MEHSESSLIWHNAYDHKKSRPKTLRSFSILRRILSSSKDTLTTIKQNIHVDVWTEICSHMNLVDLFRIRTVCYQFILFAAKAITKRDWAMKCLFSPVKNLCNYRKRPSVFTLLVAVDSSKWYFSRGKSRICIDENTGEVDIYVHKNQVEWKTLYLGPYTFRFEYVDPENRLFQLKEITCHLPKGTEAFSIILQYLKVDNMYVIPSFALVHAKQPNKASEDP